MAATSLTGCQPVHVDILVYGDSLTVNAQYAGGLVASSESVAVHARVGTALCDWAPGMAADRKDYKPKTVVIAFAGNAATCVADDYHRHGADGATANYERALRTARTAFPTEKVVVISPIAMHDLIGSLPYAGNPQLATMYKRVAAEIHATYSLAADDALTPHHVFAWTRRPLGCPTCRPVLVRTPDGVHLTPAGGKLYGAALLK